MEAEERPLVVIWLIAMHEILRMFYRNGVKVVGYSPYSPFVVRDVFFYYD